MVHSRLEEPEETVIRLRLTRRALESLMPCVPRGRIIPRVSVRDVVMHTQHRSSFQAAIRRYGPTETMKRSLKLEEKAAQS